MEQTRELLKKTNWVLIDIEYTQTSKKHKCVQNLYMLTKNGSKEFELEFYRCIR